MVYNEIPTVVFDAKVCSIKITWGGKDLKSSVYFFRFHVIFEINVMDAHVTEYIQDFVMNNTKLRFKSAV